MRRAIGFGVAVTLLVGCGYGTGIIGSRQFATSLIVGAWAALAGIAAGALIGAGYARERRAWRDYQTSRDMVPAARKAWITSAGHAARRYALPAGAVLLALMWLRGQR